MQRYIGIDLGGTNIKGALVSETGKILKQRSVPTYAEAGAEAVTKTIAAMICALAEGESVSGVGMGCPGTVDDREGTVVYACNLGWVHYDVRTALRELTGYSVRLVNDANAAALGEYAAGAGKGSQSLVLVTLGTDGAAFGNKESFCLVPTLTDIHSVDPTGAGDAFIGAFCTFVSMGIDNTSAIRMANYVGSLTVSVMGAQTSLPTLEQVGQLISQRGEEDLCRLVEEVKQCVEEKGE